MNNCRSPSSTRVCPNGGPGKKLEQSHRKLLELDRLKDEFFANINHELRTPLTVSLGAFNTLLKSPLTKESQAVVQSGLRNTSRLLFLINELLELARFESGRADLRKTCVDLADPGDECGRKF